MIVDELLIASAKNLLWEAFPTGPGRACALYSTSGKMYTSVELRCSYPQGAIEPETGAICEVAKNSETISAAVTVAWDGPDSETMIMTPTGLTLDRLLQYGLRDAEIAVHDLFDKSNVIVKPLRDLIPNHSTDSLVRQTFQLGMKAIWSDLVDVANEQGNKFISNHWIPTLLTVLENPELQGFYQKKSIRGDPSEFMKPPHLESITLRQIHYAFSHASTQFISAFVDGQSERFQELGCNESDLMHIKQGGEALRNVFANLLVFVGTGEKCENELPFRPYFSHKLKHGVPMHEYLPAITVSDGELGRTRNEELAKHVAVLLQRASKGGFLPYLRQRQLFNIPVFRGHGGGHCPFSMASSELLELTGTAIDTALEEGILCLDSP